MLESRKPVLESRKPVLESRKPVLESRKPVLESKLYRRKLNVVFFYYWLAQQTHTATTF